MDTTNELIFLPLFLFKGGAHSSPFFPSLWVSSSLDQWVIGLQDLGLRFTSPDLSSTPRLEIVDQEGELTLDFWIQVLPLIQPGQISKPLHASGCANAEVADRHWGFSVMDRVPCINIFCTSLRVASWDTKISGGNNPYLQEAYIFLEGTWEVFLS